MAECRRLAQVIWARQRDYAQWLGHDEPARTFDENCGFVSGMLAMFRYARGESVPPFVVRDFIDELLNLMFCGLASNTLALPPFSRMRDKPWASAWRLAELRLAIEAGETMNISQLAHLLGMPASELKSQICQQFPDAGDDVPAAFIQSIVTPAEAAISPAEAASQGPKHRPE